MVAVTADGRRVYFSTGHPAMGPYYNAYRPVTQPGQAQSQERPTALVAVIARPALPYMGAHRSLGRSLAGGGAVGPSTPMEVVAASYSCGSLLLSEAAGSDGRNTKLMLAARNSMLPLASVNLVSSSGAPGLRELLTELDNFIPGG